MSEKLNHPKQVRKTILLFLGILTLLSAICYSAILKLNPTSIYVGALMMCPAISAFITLKLMKRPISSLPWGLKSLKYLRLSYVIPVGYITISYLLIWIFGFGNVLNQETIKEWTQELGMEGFGSPFVLMTMLVLLSIVGVVKNIGSTLGDMALANYLFSLQRKWKPAISYFGFYRNDNGNIDHFGLLYI